MAKAKLNEKQEQFFGGTSATLEDGKLTIGDRSFEVTMEEVELKVKKKVLKWHKLYVYTVEGEGVSTTFETRKLEPLNNYHTIQYAVRAISRATGLTAGPAGTGATKASLSQDELDEIAAEKALLKSILKK